MPDVQLPIWVVIIAALCSGGLFAGVGSALIVNWFNRRKTKADTALTNAETEAIHLSTEAHRITALGASNLTIEGLLEEADKHIKKMRETNSQLVKAQAENDFLTMSLTNAKSIIEYQKTERHEWTEQLKKVLAELAESKVEIESLTKRIGDLEQANTEHQ